LNNNSSLTNIVLSLKNIDMLLSKNVNEFMYERNTDKKEFIDYIEQQKSEILESFNLHELITFRYKIWIGNNHLILRIDMTMTDFLNFTKKMNYIKIDGSFNGKLPIPMYLEFFYYDYNNKLFDVHFRNLIFPLNLDNLIQLLEIKSVVENDDWENTKVDGKIFFEKLKYDLIKENKKSISMIKSVTNSSKSYIPDEVVRHIESFSIPNKSIRKGGRRMKKKKTMKRIKSQ
jgi:hypothetical protein